MNLRRHLAVLSAALLASIALQAGPAGRSAQLERREARQRQRIDQGIGSGSLTLLEQATLQHQEARLTARIDHAQADGVVTPGESLRINHAQNIESRRIFRKKHNGRVMP